MKETDKILIGIWRKIISMPPLIYNKEINRFGKIVRARINRLSEEENKIHHFVVRELPNVGKPISFEFIARELNISADRVSSHVEKLEKKKTYFYRYNDEGINWAYPVTVDNTPHHVSFSTGESINAA